MKRYIIVADAARARVLVRDSLGPIKEVDELHHPEGRMHPGELEERGKGEVHESSRTTVRASDKRTGVSEKHEAAFAKTLAHYMKALRTQGDADGFVVAAAPSLLGELRSKLDDATGKLVEQTVDKDYTQESADEIGRKLAM